MVRLFLWMMLALKFVSNHREKPAAARMPPLVILICAMMSSVLGHSGSFQLADWGGGPPILCW